ARGTGLCWGEEDDGESWVRWRVAGRVGEGAGKVGGKKRTVTVSV
nr:hypothetical protein [Tanacetum cinerariifolium]